MASEAIVMRQEMGSVIVRFPTQNVVMGAPVREPIVMAAQPKTVVVTVGHQGPPGIQGPIGPAGGQAMERIAGVAISALRVVYEDALGRVFPLDATDDAHIFSILGIALTAADAGRAVSVQRSGPIDDASWGWVPGQRVYLGAAGGLSGEPAEEGFHVFVGTAVSQQRLLLSLQDPVQLWAEEAEGE